MYEQQQGKPKPQRLRKSKAISKAVIETEDISSVEDFAPSPSATSAGAGGAPGRRSSTKVSSTLHIVDLLTLKTEILYKKKVKKDVKVKTEDEDSHEMRTEDERIVEKERKKEKSAAKKEKKKKKDVGPMHFTASSEPRAVEMIGDLDPVIFQEVNLSKPYQNSFRAVSEQFQSSFLMGNL